MNFGKLVFNFFRVQYFGNSTEFTKVTIGNPLKRSFPQDIFLDLVSKFIC